MKRKKILNNFSLFSNTKNHGDKDMEIKVTKVYRVGGVEYTSREEAFKATAREILQKHYEEGIDSLIQNAAEVRRALSILGKEE